MSTNKARTRTAEQLETKRECDRRWAAKNPERLRELHRKANLKWRAKNLEREREASRRRWADNPEKARENARTRRANDPEGAREANRKWRANNPEKAREGMRRWRATDPERARELDRKWGATDRGRASVAATNLRRRIRVGGMRMTMATFLEVQSQSSGYCPYCGERIVIGEVDHIVPVAMGGSIAQFNLAWVCQKCNRSKGNRSVPEFLLYRRNLGGLDKYRV